MKGLLKNNLYAGLSNMKFFSIIMVLSGLFVCAVISPALMTGYALLSMVGFSLISILSLGKENTSKWRKYKLTMPIKRGDIIKSYYISQLIWLAVGVGFAVIVLGLSTLLHGVTFDRNVDVPMLLTLGISISLLMDAIFFPLLYSGNDEKNEVFLIVSLLGSVGIVMGISSFLNWFFNSPMTRVQLLISMAVMIGCGGIGFSVSLPLAIEVFKKKEY